MVEHACCSVNVECWSSININVRYDFASYFMVLSCIDSDPRDVAKKKRENVGIFPKSGTHPPSPPFGNVMLLRKKIMVYFAF